MLDFYVSIASIAIIALILPYILRLLGLHPNYNIKNYNLEGRKALIITTSQSTLGNGGKSTGVFASEMNVPYYAFLDAGISVDIASIKGGKIPVEPISLKYPIATKSDRRFLKDQILEEKVKNSMKIDDVDFTSYDIIFMAGGWGAAYDLGISQVLGDKLTDANAQNILIGSVCHGALGFIKAKKNDGSPLVKDKNITAVSNRQIKELGISTTPMHPETELRKLGANYKSKRAFKDIFANLTVIDGNFVSGQNQNSAGETADKLMMLLETKIKKQ